MTENPSEKAATQSVSCFCAKLDPTQQPCLYCNRLTRTRPPTGDGEAVHPSLELCVQFSEDGQHIRKWSRIPFEGGTDFYSHPATPNSGAEDGVTDEDLKVATEIWSMARGYGVTIYKTHTAAQMIARHRLTSANTASERDKALEITDEKVREAMQAAWDDFCADAGAHPDDIYREGRLTYFRAGTWADHTAMHLRRSLSHTKEG